MIQNRLGFFGFTKPPYTPTGGFPVWSDNNLDVSLFVNAYFNYKNDVDPFVATYSIRPETYTGTFKWTTPVLAPNGNLYCSPSGSDMILRIDPTTDVGTKIGTNYGTSGGKWIGGCLAPNGKIYFSFYNATSILELDPVSETTTTFGSEGGSGKSYNIVCGKNGKLYALPFLSSYFYEIDPDTHSITKKTIYTKKYIMGSVVYGDYIYFCSLVGEIGKYNYVTDTVSTIITGFVTNSYNGAYLAPNGYIYFTIFNNVTSYIKMDPRDDSYSLIYVGSGYTSNYGHVPTADGVLVGVPVKKYTIPYFDTKTDTASSFDFTGSGVTDEMYEGGGLAMNGKIYFAMRSATKLAVIGSAQSKPLDENFTLSRYINKW